MGLLPLDNFLCWKLKIATMAICIFTIVSASRRRLELELDDDGREAGAYCPISAFCLQNLSSLDLKMLTESVAIISCGRLFQWSTTLWMKKFLLISPLLLTL